MEANIFLEAVAVGFLLFSIVADDRSPFRRRLPQFRIKRVEFFPTFRIYASRRFVHFHHWFIFSIILLASLFATGGLLGYLFTKGFLLGGVIQGLTSKNQKTTKGLIHKQKIQEAKVIKVKSY